jgi:hypothetical protein
MAKDRIKRRDNGLYRKFWITCDRNDKKFKIVSADRRRPNSKFKKIKCLMHIVLVEEGKDNEIWKFTIIESEHNYEFLKFSALPAIRKIYKNKNFKKKIALKKTAGI